MDTLVERCAGLDIGKADLKACVRTPGKNARRVREIRTFATTTVGLLQLRDWLTGHQVTVVGMEATGDYWKPSLSRFPCKPRVTSAALVDRILEVAELTAQAAGGRLDPPVVAVLDG